MENTFDLSQFDKYREDNRREVKKQMVVCQFHCGTRILLLQIAMAVSLSSVSKKKKMVDGKLPVFRMRPSSEKTFGIPSIILKK